MEVSSPLIIIGLGSQATAWAQNLRDSGRKIIIALRKSSSSSSLSRAKKLGFDTIELCSDELKTYKHFFILIPDTHHEDFFKSNLQFITEGSFCYYAHGYSYINGDFKKRYSQVKHLLLAPKAIASEVRHRYQMDGNLGAAYSVEDFPEPEKAASLLWLKGLGKDLGLTSLFQSTFKEETYADLFSEQTLLCSLLPYGALHSFNHLVKKGISEEIAYMECWLEVKLIADAMVKLGPKEFFELISPNALIGGEKAQKLIFDDNYMKTLEKLSSEIWNREFFTTCEEIDSTKLRTDVVNRWSKEKLTQTFERIGSKLV